MIRRFQADKTKTQAANELGVSKAHYGDIIANRRAPGPTVLKHFGLVKIDAPPIYRKAS